MPENVSFNQVPVDIRTPGQYIEIDNSRAVQGLPAQERRILLIGQALGGTAAAETPYRVTNLTKAEELFGLGSVLADMCAASLSTGLGVDLWAIAPDEVDNQVAATCTIDCSDSKVVSGGTLYLYVGGHRVQVPVAASDVAATIAAAVKKAVEADAYVAARATVALSGTDGVKLTAKNKGLIYNDVPVTLNYYQGETTPEGVSVTIANGGFSGGSLQPNIKDVVAEIDTEHYHSVVSAWPDAATISALEADAAQRFGPMSQQPAHVYVALEGTHAELTTYGTARNSPHSSTLGVHGSPTPAWQVAAIWATVAHYHLGIDPARPLQTLSLPGFLPPPEADRFNRQERDLLLHDGISTFTVDQGGLAHIERVITTYQENPQGVQDISYLDVNTVETVNYIRYAIRVKMALRYPRHKLANDGTSAALGQAVATPALIRDELLALFRELEDAGLVENFDQFKKDLIVVRSTSDPNRVNCVFPSNIVNQFRVFAAAVQFRL